MTSVCDDVEVHEDPGQLLELYRHLGEIPDVWSLAEWSDWLTPTDLHEQGTRRKLIDI
jgi:hypothetical protein